MPPIETFEQLIVENQVPEQVVKNLAACGYETPTPIQMQAIPILLKVSLGDFKGALGTIN